MTLGVGAAIAISIYLLILITVGYLTKQHHERNGLGDFYLAGRNLGGFVLLLTLYATQYSGNTLLGYPGEAFQLGFAWVMSVGFMMAIIVVYLLFAPGLQRAARRHQFITPGDWITHRFNSPLLTFLANLLLVAAISNYLLAQLMAMGHVAEGLSGGTIPYWVGVVLLTLVVIIYETVGGMRAVAWTDCLQGLMLLCGLTGLLVVVAPTPSHLAELTSQIMATHPEKVAVPSWEVSRNWFSTILLIGISGAVYPHAIQRIYAARDGRTLKRAFSVMVFLPLVTTGIIFMVGILAIGELSITGDPDQVMPTLLTEWANRSGLLYALSVVVITAIVAAIMSTADSVLLSLSSILAKDIVGTTLLKGASEERLTKVGKLLSWAIISVLLVIALSPRVTLWGLTEIKMEILAQVSPLFILGVVWPRLSTTAALVGMLAGSSTYVTLLMFDRPEIWNIHAGILALAVNVLCCCLITTLRQQPSYQQTVTTT